MMIPNSGQAIASSLSLSLTGAGNGFFLPQEDSGSASAGLGVSTAAAPLISAPAARQSSEFQANIAPPTRPTNPSIAPPQHGSDTSLSGTGRQMGSMQTKMSYIAALGLERASSSSNGPSGGKNEVMPMMGKSQAA